MGADYNDTQAKILRVLSENPPSLPAGPLKDGIDSVTRNAVDKQIGQLRDSGEVEKVGEGEPDREGQWAPNVYALTRKGKKAAAQLPEGDTEAPDDVPDEVTAQLQALREKVMGLEKEVAAQAEYIDTLEARVGENTDQLDTNEERFKTLNRRTKDLKERVDSDAPRGAPSQ